MNWWFPGSRASVQTHQRRRSWSRAENKDNRPLILTSMFGFGLKQQPLQRPLLVQLSWTCTLSFWSKRLTFNGSAWDVVGVRFTCDLRCLGCCFLFPGVICIRSVSLVKPCEPAPCVLVVDTGPVQSQSFADTGAEQQRSRRMFGLFLLLMALIKLQQRKVKRIEPRPWNTIETEKCKSSHHQMILHVEGHRFLRLQIFNFTWRRFPSSCHFPIPRSAAEGCLWRRSAPLRSEQSWLVLEMEPLFLLQKEQKANAWRLWWRQMKTFPLSTNRT